jgi:hypothetical protein
MNLPGDSKVHMRAHHMSCFCFLLCGSGLVLPLGCSALLFVVPLMNSIDVGHSAWRSAAVAQHIISQITARFVKHIIWIHISSGCWKHLHCAAGIPT